MPGFHPLQQMTITSEEELAVLYALYCLDGCAKAGAAIEFIIERGLLLPRADDVKRVGNGELNRVNRIRWKRQNLVMNGRVDGSTRGYWRLTESGKRHLFRVAISRYRDARVGLALLDEYTWERFSSGFIEKLRELGNVQDRLALADAGNHLGRST
jgi:hypothetical protein